MTWWSPTIPGGSLWTAQPVAHALGGILWAAFALLLWWPRGGWQPIVFAGGMTAYWQLRVWEPEPDGTYPLAWVVWDTLTAMTTATVAVVCWEWWR
jgi:hypothetical protein